MSDPNDQTPPQEEPVPLSLYNKIMIIYPDLTVDDFRLDRKGFIILRDDGEGAYIYSWTHPIYPRPTQEQLDAIVSP